jgi:hypothetical protein
MGLTGLALRTLPRGLSRIVALLGDLCGTAVRAGHALGPTQRANGREALHVVDEALDLHHHPWAHHPVETYVQRVETSDLR